MDTEPLQVEASPPDNRSHSPLTPALAQTKVTRTRRTRKKGTRDEKVSVDLNTDKSATTSTTPAFPDAISSQVDEVCPREPALPEKLDYRSNAAAFGEEDKSIIEFNESASKSSEEGTSSNVHLGERQSHPCHQVLSCAPSTPVMATSGAADEPTTFLLPLCESGPLPCQQIMPSAQQLSGIAPPPGIPDEPPGFMLPLGDGPSLQRQQIMPGSAPPPGFPMKIVHFGPPPHLLSMGQFYGHPPMVTPFHPQPAPMAHLMGPPPPVGHHFVGPPHQFLRTPNPTNTYFRPVFWDPRNPYGAHPYANTILSTQMPFPGYALGPRRRRPATTKPRKPRRKASDSCVLGNEQNAAANNMNEPVSQGTSDETSPQETFIAHETCSQDTAQETTMDKSLPQETTMDLPLPQETMTDDDLTQGTIINESFLEGTMIDEPLLEQETIMNLSMDVPDMCNEVEVESTLSLNEEEGVGLNADETAETEEVHFPPNLSTNVVSLDLNHIDRELAPPSPTPAKTRRMSHKKDQMKLVFDRKSEAMVKAAKGLFTKRTRTLYTWLYPNTSKREVKTSVSKAWDLLPESEKAYYLAQVDGRLGIHPGLMVNPQLEGLVKLPEDSGATFGSSRSGRARGTSDDSSDYSSDTSDAENHTTEAARAVRNLFASNGDVETWTSFAHHEADNKRFRRRKRRKSSDTVDVMEGNNSTDEARRRPGERDAELECELAKFRQILENDNNLNDDDSYWRVVPEPNPDELFLDIIQE